MTYHELGLGRRPAPDERDRRYQMQALAEPAEPLRGTKYWWTIAKLDQGSTPQCVGYACANWQICSPTRTLNGPTPQEIYRAAQQVDEWPGEGYAGTSVRAGMKVLQDLGYIAEYRWAWDADTAARWILQRGPVVLGTNWYYEMYWLDRYGYARPRGTLVGGHAYLAVGYSATRGAFRCLNSWGGSWGEAGRFWLAHADLERLLRENGEACAAVERPI